jgi:NADH dehydrogenase [ubiquinone] 1 alpha subcomplex assembly factor 1
LNQLTQPAPELNQLHRRLQWQLFNDNVMGGQSSSAFAWQADCLTFSGFVNTNGGGFASIRTEPDPGLAQNLNKITNPMISIVIQGDQQRYQLGVQTQNKQNYWVDVDSPAQWQTLNFPLAEFVAKRRGHPVVDAKPLEVTDITGFNLMISHGQHGPFELQICNLYLHEALDH